MLTARWNRFTKSNAFYDAPSFRIGTTESHSLTVRLHEREFPKSKDYWDGNWVWTSIMLPPSVSRAPLVGTLHMTDLDAFREQLSALARRKQRMASLMSLECFLEIEIDATDEDAWVTTYRGFDEHRRKFYGADLCLNRAGLPELRRQVDVACAAFPIVGALQFA